ncbi:MAG: transcription elongation factor GreA [Candidatus Staskawiczbacteria bacterium]
MPQYFTAEGIKKLKEELHQLKTVETKKVVALLKYAASFGDLKENAGYDDAKERQAFLVTKIKQLEAVINDAIIYEKGETDKVQIGSTVLLVFGEDKEEFHIVAPAESDILNNKLSYQSPLGRELIGRKTKDEFFFENNGAKVKVKILEIR